MKKSFLFVLFFFFISQNVSAQEYAASLKLSSIGITAEGMRSLNDNLNVRLGISMLPLKYDGGGGTEDYTYSADVNLFAISLLADWYPFNNFLKVTGGLIVNLNKIKAVATPTETHVVGGDYYTPEKLGNMNVDIKMNRLAPYLGLGIGNPLAGSSGLSFTFEIGTFYQGTPSVDLSASGLIEPSAAPDQEETMEDNLSWFKFYPVVSFGLTYKF